MVRIGFESQIRLRNIPPEIDLPGQGFTKQRMRASEGRQTIGGKTYNILTYKTAIAAARTGTIESGRSKRGRRPGPAIAAEPLVPQNPLNMNDPFESFFNDPWPMGVFRARSS